MSKAWFITGVNRGFGLKYARAALLRGDRVPSTSRQVSGLNPQVTQPGNRVLPLVLNVSELTGVTPAVEQAATRFSRLDVVLNNAGHSLFDAVEEISEQQLREQLEVNLFEVLHVIPASDWTGEGLTENLTREVGPLGIKTTLVKQGPFGTVWTGTPAVFGPPTSEYEHLRADIQARSDQLPPTFNLKPEAAGRAALTVLNAGAHSSKRLRYPAARMVGLAAEAND